MNRAGGKGLIRRGLNTYWEGSGRANIVHSPTLGYFAPGWPKSQRPMPAASKPVPALSFGFIKLKLKPVTNKVERKKACETLLARMLKQREAQKKSRTNIEDTDDAIRFLKSEIEHLKKG